MAFSPESGGGGNRLLVLQRSYGTGFSDNVVSADYVNTFGKRLSTDDLAEVLFYSIHFFPILVVGHMWAVDG